MPTPEPNGWHDRGRVQELHFVGFTSDHRGLVFSPEEDATSGDYFVQIDEYLAAAIEQRPGGSADGDEQEQAGETRSRPAPVVVTARAKPVSDLSPREIQTRLRKGMSVSEVAEEAGVAEEWVLRFADPIRAEQGRVVEQALGLTFTKPRVGPSDQPLRTSVRWNLAEQGALRHDEVFDAGWSASHLYGTRWVVRFSYVAKRRRRLAEWEVDLREGELTARNRVATDLGYVEPGRRRKRPPESIAPPSPVPTRGRYARGTKTSKTARTKKAAASRKDAASRGTKARKAPKKAPKRAATAAKAAPRKAPPAPRAAVSTRAAPAKKAAPARGASSKKVALSKKAPPAPVSKKAPPAPVSKKATQAPVSKKAPPAPVSKKAAAAKKAPLAKRAASKSAGAREAAAVAEAPPAAPEPTQTGPGPAGAWPQLPGQPARSEPAEGEDGVREERPALVIMSTPEVGDAGPGEAGPPPSGRRWFSRQPGQGGNPPSHEDWWG